MTTLNEVTREEFHALKAQVEGIIQRHNDYDESLRDLQELEKKIADNAKARKNAHQSDSGQNQDLAESARSSEIDGRYPPTS